MRIIQKLGLRLLAASFVLAGTLSAAAKDYLVDPSATQTGAAIVYKGRTFIVGETAFSGIWGLLGAGIEENSDVYFNINAVGSFTISTSNVRLFGRQAFCHETANTRNTSNETQITGTLKIAKGVKGIMINGFTFSGNGQIICNEAGRGSTAVENVEIVYNRFINTTVTAGEGNAIVNLGLAWRPSNSDAAINDPTKWACNQRFVNVTIAHNVFKGKNATGQPNVIQVAGSGGNTSIVDNSFEYGGTSISLFNTCGNFNIDHNRFINVGADAAGKTEKTYTGGYFAIRLYYIGARSVEKADGSVCHNIFDGCQGQSTMFAPIRLFSGNSSETVIAPYGSLAVNHNHFKNKTSYRSSGYNYVFYADEATAANFTVDWRYNHYDQSELCFGMIRPAWETRTGRYFASSSEIFEHTTAASESEGTGTLLDYYGAKTAPDGSYFGGEYPPKTRLKNQTFKATTTITTVVQSFDRDDVTGNFYFMQVMNKQGSNGGGPYYGESPCVVTETAYVGSGFKETQMFLDFAGHGSNMAVLNVNGTCWMFIGGCSGAKGGSTTPTKICILPFVAGATVDVRQNSFTYNGKTYEIKHVNRSMSASYTHPYPSVDRDNNLFVERSRSSAGDYFTVYDLMEVFNNPANANPIKQLFMKAGSLPIRNSSRDFYNTADKGFKTWSDQGFTISGDYIYTWEGNALEGYSGTPTPTDGKPTMIINVANWRTGEYVYRKAVMKGTVYGSSDPGPYKLDPGEPEGIKVHRESNGRASLWIGVVNGKSGARQYNVYAYRLKRTNGQGRVYNTHTPARNLNADKSSMSFYSYTADGSSDNIRCSVSPDVRDVHFSVSGPGANAFVVEKTGGDVFNHNHTARVTFCPDGSSYDYKATLRVSAPGVQDVLVPLNARTEYSGVEDVMSTPVHSEITEYYDINGRRLNGPVRGINIVRRADGSVSKIINR